MKKIITCLLSMILCCTFLYTPNNTVEAYTVDSIENNTIQFLTYEYPIDLKTRVLEFKFVDQGNNTAKLKPYYNGKFIEINEIPSNLALYSDLYFTLSTIYGHKSVNYLDRGMSMRGIAQFLESLTFTYGVDAVQIARVPQLSIHFITEGTFTFGYGGKIQGNLNNRDFNDALMFYNNSHEWRFRVRKDGLHAEYLSHSRLEDGEYYIETEESSNRVLDILSGNNIEANNYIPSGNTQTQKVILEFDEVNFATTIKFARNNKYLTWDKANGYNVVAADKMTSGDIGQQYWYLVESGNGTYNIVSARDHDRFLNLDSNNTNISVSNNRNNASKQKFRIVKANEKQNIFDNNIKIVSKLNNNKILNVDIGGKTGRELTIWDNANVSQQRFKFEYDEYKNAYRIRDNYYGGYLSCDIDVNSNRVYSSQQVQTASYWALEPTGDGYYYIKNLHNDKVLDVRSSDIYNGNEVIAYKKLGGNNQKFKLVQG